MLSIYHTVNNVVVPTEEIEKGCWIDLIKPTPEELRLVSEATGIYEEFLHYPLDDEELARVEVEDDQMMVIINVPIKNEAEVMYETLPLGIVQNDDFIVTVCLADMSLGQEFVNSRLKNVATFKKTRFLFQLFQKETNLYVRYLRDIRHRNDIIERELHKSMKNRELFQLLDQEKSLVYFSTSLRSNDKVMEKLLRSKYLKMYEEDEDLLEDVLIENKQAMEMVEIYSSITSGTMDAFASIISNNLNIVMKLLAGITIVLSIPTMISSFFGMNVSLPISPNNPWGFLIILVISVVACLIGAVLLSRKNML